MKHKSTKILLYDSFRASNDLQCFYHCERNFSSTHVNKLSAPLNYKFILHYNVEVPYNFAFMHQAGIPPFFLSEPTTTGLFSDFSRPLGAQAWVQASRCIKPKYPILRFPTTLFLCAKAKLQLFLSFILHKTKESERSFT